MMESRNYYYGNENPVISNGWSARITYKGDYGVNRGCKRTYRTLESR